MQKLLLTFFLAILIVFALFSNSAYAADFSFSDNFTGDFNIARNLSNYKFVSGTLTAADNSISSRVVSTLLISTSYNIGSAKLEVSESFPAGGTITYFLSNNNGDTWVAAPKNAFVNFSSFGKQIRWSAVIARADINSASPEIHSIKITARESDSALSSSNDSQRISDLSTVANAISDFYKDYGIYPHVDATAPELRWNALMTLLSRNRNGGRDSTAYLSSPVNDPLNYLDNRSYDYKDISPSEYVLSAGLELPSNNILLNDIDGNWGSINCNDPFYCIGILHGQSYNPSSGANSTAGGGQVLGAYIVGTLGNSDDRELNDMLGRRIFTRGNFALGPTNTANFALNINTGSLSNHSGNNNTAVAGASIAKASSTPTGTTNSIALALLLSALTTSLFVLYSKTAIFKKRDIQDIIKRQSSDKNRFNFAL